MSIGFFVGATLVVAVAIWLALTPKEKEKK
jgi:hypothetical protein